LLREAHLLTEVRSRSFVLPRLRISMITKSPHILLMGAKCKETKSAINRRLLNKIGRKPSQSERFLFNSLSHIERGSSTFISLLVPKTSSFCRNSLQIKIIRFI
jgi:hypothetical protein